MISLSSSANAVKVQLDIRGKGFHRYSHTALMLPFSHLKDLFCFREVEVSFDAITLTSENCKFMVKWNIPPGAYVDPYQMQNLINNQSLHFTSDVNVEHMMHLSPSLTFYSCASPNCSGRQCSLSQVIPIHARYHLPSSTTHSHVQLSSPKLFSSCQANFLPCFNETLEQCGWETIPTDILKKEFDIPVGDVHLSLLVNLVTVFFTLTGSSFVALAVMKH